MKTKTSNLEGLALDWAVAKALGHAVKVRTWRDITDALDPVEDADLINLHKEANTVRVSEEIYPGGGWFPVKSYSTNWAQGGPIIEREGIELNHWDWFEEGWWVATHKKYLSDIGVRSYGPTPLIAILRCFVTSRLGDEVEIPDELATA